MWMMGMWVDADQTGKWMIAIWKWNWMRMRMGLQMGLRMGLRMWM
jgi:hypothetical protein